jgi:BirA family biotin operon repressor/biotin-[acetyl-CoA-carboxylase] ligase
MDLAHDAAEAGAPAGTLVVADRQQRGRGRGGQEWMSRSGDGLWMTLIERPVDRQVIGVLSLRVGLALARALAPHVDAPIMLKWPNDVLVRERKVAGILIEARWRDAAVEWVAIGIGINLRVPSAMPTAAAVRDGVTRNQLLVAVCPPLREVVARVGLLSEAERVAWSRIDVAKGRRLTEPCAGIALGIAADGALRVAGADGVERLVHSGSLRFAD